MIGVKALVVELIKLVVVEQGEVPVRLLAERGERGLSLMLIILFLPVCYWVSDIGEDSGSGLGTEERGSSNLGI